jgi:hypothetical protein
MNTRYCSKFSKGLAILSVIIVGATAAFLPFSSFGSGVFTHWTAFDGSSATGVLGSSSVALSTDVQAGNLGSAVRGGITNGTFAGYSSNYFTPNISNTDVISLEAASSFTLTFQPPVTNPTLQIYQLANNTLSFSDGTNPIVFELLSSDGTFGMANGATGSSLTGTPSSTDSSGSICFTGTFSRISWHSNAANPNDGIGLQITLPLPVLSIQPATNGVMLLWPASLNIFRLQQNTNLATTSWVPNTNLINVVNGTNQVTISPAAGNQFFRLTYP